MQWKHGAAGGLSGRCRRLTEQRRHQAETLKAEANLNERIVSEFAAKGPSKMESPIRQQHLGAMVHP
jgi:hypothetical protein